MPPLPSLPRLSLVVVAVVVMVVRPPAETCLHTSRTKGIPLAFHRTFFVASKQQPPGRRPPPPPRRSDDPPKLKCLIDVCYLSLDHPELCDATLTVLRARDAVEPCNDTCAAKATGGVCLHPVVMQYLLDRYDGLRCGPEFEAIFWSKGSRTNTTTTTAASDIKTTTTTTAASDIKTTTTATRTSTKTTNYLQLHHQQHTLTGDNTEAPLLQSRTQDTHTQTPQQGRSKLTDVARLNFNDRGKKAGNDITPANNTEEGGGGGRGGGEGARGGGGPSKATGRKISHSEADSRRKGVTEVTQSRGKGERKLNKHGMTRKEEERKRKEEDEEKSDEQKDRSKKRTHSRGRNKGASPQIHVHIKNIHNESRGNTGLTTMVVWLSVVVVMVVVVVVVASCGLLVWTRLRGRKRSFSLH